MKRKYYVGVDISKSKLDITIIDGSYQIVLQKIVLNKSTDLQKFFSKLLLKLKTSRAELLICCEETGIYGRPLEIACTENQLPLWVEQAIKIKNATTDIRGKSDKKDALRIAQFACRYADRERLFTEPGKENRELQTLLNARETLLLQLNQLSQQLNESKELDKEKFLQLSQCFDKPIKALKKQLLDIEKQITALTEANAQMNKNVQLLSSIPGVGQQIACQFIVYTRNFTSFESAKHLACYAGVAPFPNESGTIIKKARVSSFANKKLKKLLHLAAMAAIRAKGDLRDYFIRKVSEGKNKMLVLNNVRNKLVQRMFAVIKRETEYVSINLETTLAS